MVAFLGLMLLSRGGVSLHLVHLISVSPRLARVVSTYLVTLCTGWQGSSAKQMLAPGTAILAVQGPYQSYRTVSLSTLQRYQHAGIAGDCWGRWDMDGMTCIISRRVNTRLAPIAVSRAHCA